ncbi:hypothetical protein BDV06DRAFT_222239 [Aspergillus oleicola]
MYALNAWPLSGKSTGNAFYHPDANKMGISIYNCMSPNDLCRKCKDTFAKLVVSGHFTPSELLNTRNSYPLILTREFRLDKRSMISVPSKNVLEKVIKKLFPKNSPRV